MNEIAFHILFLSSSCYRRTLQTSRLRWHSGKAIRSLSNISHWRNWIYCVLWLVKKQWGMDGKVLFIDWLLFNSMEQYSIKNTCIPLCVSYKHPELLICCEQMGSPAFILLGTVLLIFLVFCVLCGFVCVSVLFLLPSVTWASWLSIPNCLMILNWLC